MNVQLRVSVISTLLLVALVVVQWNASAPLPLSAGIPQVGGEKRACQLTGRKVCWRRTKGGRPAGDPGEGPHGHWHTESCTACPVEPLVFWVAVTNKLNALLRVNVRPVSPEVS